MTVRLLTGDCRDILKTLPAASIDAIVSDPPSGTFFMGKSWDHDKGGRDAWVSWLTEILAECLRVAKPGAHAFIWALPRTSGWTHRALEDAGWEVRDCVTHLFGSGFPKSLDVSKAMDKAAGAEREDTGKLMPGHTHGRTRTFGTGGDIYGEAKEAKATVTLPATNLAREWQGWGTALKPAAEFWYLARKPLAEKSIAANVERYGTGAINVDGCRIDLGGESPPSGSGDRRGGAIYAQDEWTRTQMANGGNTTPSLGRWPANLILDEEAAAMLDAQSGDRPGQRSQNVKSAYRNKIYSKGMGYRAPGTTINGRNDTGGASRFFYTAKSSRSERNKGLDDLPARRVAVLNAMGDDPNDDIDPISNRFTTTKRNFHPTVKPVSLMRWLVRLVCPPGGVVLDPFTGSGTTGVACVYEELSFIGIEQEAEYIEIARRRIERAQGPMFAAVEVE